ncbi:hypothetical protein [Algisphaera agarilytica]|uniref:Uncharacterized protein n=1 Tax=Algisphaera agarilytica TaxID=1385975 RepID=A0A7X0H4L1_9BACT|nr:hypothetical protein [Algisphaera agarilytica]MBB6428983.1 hypothetical protein [Algisphaera agarilytica]
MLCLTPRKLSSLLPTPYFTTHADLVERQAKAQEAKRAAVAAKAAAKQAEREGITIDDKWDGDDFVQQSDDLVSG